MISRRMGLSSLLILSPPLLLLPHVHYSGDNVGWNCPTLHPIDSEYLDYFGMGSVVGPISHGHAQFHEVVHDSLYHFPCGGITSPLMNNRPAG